MAIFRGAGGPGDATTDAANEASVASTKAAEAEASATAAASSAISASNSATTAINSKDAAATSESNAASSALAASTSEANAANSETNASDSESNAATSETNAANSASSALTSKNAAAISEANASTSETNASASASAASTSAASAAASYDGFDDRYLGAKSTDPTVDNDNDPLITGALYFNTTSNDMKVYNGSAWEVTFATLSGALVAANNLSDVVDVASSRTNLGLGTTDNVTFNDVTATGNIAVTGTVDGRDVATDGTKLDGIEASATADQTGAEIKAAYELEANAFTDAQFTKLAGIEASATADQTAGEIKTAYESNADTNAFTDAQVTKLAGIETAADVTDTTNVTAAGAVMDSELTSEASVKALDQGVATTDSPSFAGLTVDTNTLYVDSTNNRVGIGTSSPAEPLHVIGTVRSNTSSTGDFNFYATSTGGGGYRIYPDDATTANPTWLYQSNSSEDQAWVIGGVERMRITSAGNVGIGTNSPLTKLVTVGTTMATSQAFVGSVADTSYSGGIINLSNTSRSIGITSDPTNAGASSILNFSVDGSERMRINSSGNVGIGTSSPAVDLDIENSDTAIIQLKDTGDTRSGAIKVRNGDLTLVNGIGVSGAGTERAKIVLSDNSFMSFDTGATERMRINSSGNVGIGTSSPSQKLMVSGTDARIYLTGANTDIDMTGTADGQLSLDGNGYAFGIALNANGANLYTNAVSRDLIFGVNETEVMRVTSDSVGIGTSSPASLMHLSSGSPRITLTDTGTGADHRINADSSVGNLAFDVDYNSDTASPVVVFNIKGSERMRINNAGDLLLNTTITGVQDADSVATDSSLGRLHLNTTSTSGLLFLNQTYNDTVARYQILFYRRESVVGSITSSTSVTAYNTTSDYRLKENLNSISNGIDRVKQLNPLRFNFIANPEETVDGFLAHEVDSIVPEAITGEKDALDEKGNIDPQQIDQSKLVPLLTAALQEAITKIEALEARVTALESN